MSYISESSSFNALTEENVFFFNQKVGVRIEEKPISEFSVPSIHFSSESGESMLSRKINVREEESCSPFIRLENREEKKSFSCTGSLSFLFNNILGLKHFNKSENIFFESTKRISKFVFRLFFSPLFVFSGAFGSFFYGSKALFSYLLAGRVWDLSEASYRKNFKIFQLDLISFLGSSFLGIQFFYSIFPEKFERVFQF